MSKYFSASFYKALACGVACTFVHSAWSQETIDLPVPIAIAEIEEVAADFFVEPSVAVTAIEADDFETLTRGPLHEAFAEPIVADPAPGFVVAVEPPPPINELMPEFRPDGDDAIWIAGYWGWDEQREDFVWISGVYRVPPAGHQWVPGYWHQVINGWQWVQGFWVEDIVGSISYLPAPPATLENGPSSPSPGTDYFYIPGNWSQASSGFLWNAGYWHPMQDDLVWVPSHTVWTPRGCVYVAGYWDHRLPMRGLCFAPVSVSRVTYSQPGWCLRPNVVLNSQIVLQNLFVQPGYNHYLFGDYYGLPSNNRHVLPAYVYHQRRGSCDPLISFYSAYNLRQGQDMMRWCGNHYADLNRNPEKRPPHQWKPTVGNGVTNATPLLNESLHLAHSLEQVNKISSGLRVSPISANTKQNILQRDLEHKQLAKDRELSERINAGQGLQTLALPKAEISRRKSDVNNNIGKLPEKPRYTPPSSPRNAPRLNDSLNALGNRPQGNFDSVPRRVESKQRGIEPNRDMIRDVNPPSAIEQLGRIQIPNQPRALDAVRRLDIPNRLEQNRIKEQSRPMDPPKTQVVIPERPLGNLSPPTDFRNRMNNPLETRGRPFTPPAGAVPNPTPPIFPQPRRQEIPPETRSNTPSQPERQLRLGTRQSSDRGNSTQNEQGKKPR